MRRRAWGALGEGVFDLLVVGGGSVGAGIALHATARGLRTALVERGDFGEGTSSRSTKLIHGGVRYLERALTHLDRAEFALVREALLERAAFFRLAPFLCRRLGILAPAANPWERLYFAAGLRLYDRLAGAASLGRTRVLGRAEALEVFPTLGRAGAAGGVLYYDGQFDDARLNVLLALTAAAGGAVVLNYAEVVALVREGGRVAGAEVVDRIGGAGASVRARVVVNAAGPFADAVRALDDPGAEPLLTTSSGAHVVLAGERCPTDTGLILPRTRDGRVLFVLPWQGHTLVGTTDRAAAPQARPAVAAEDVEDLLAHLRGALGWDVRSADVAAAWCGFRPLVRDPRRRGTAMLVRSHLVVESPGGLVSALGGKWTTFRRVATDAVDHAVRHRGLPAAPAPADVALLGAAGYDPVSAAAAVCSQGLSPAVAQALATRYGTRAAAVAALAAQGYGRLLAERPPCLEAEVVWAARAEMAQRVLDVLARRLRLAFLDRREAARAVPRVASLLAAELGWDDRRRTAEEAAAREELRTAI
jgi:glycerol-3-phosphate dehydrogenase